MNQPIDILKKYWKHSRFRPLQEDIIKAVIGGRDVLAILPTGGGKSVCFQVPAMMKNGICIVVTPLIALMKDQVENLKNIGIRAAAVYSGMHLKEVDITLDNCIYGDLKFLYVSPERIQSEIFKERVKRMHVNLIAVDEAHCISQWGHDFRPAYFEINTLRDMKPEVKVIALTATATRQVQDEIVDKLQLEEPEIFTGSFARENLSYSVRKVEDKERKLAEILNKIPGTSIVYTKTRKQSKEVSDILKATGISSGYYHAGLTYLDRIKMQDEWKSGKVRVIVATNAFGMGIDKPDVRSVIHLGLNDNIESYYQEAGRAGRDGNKSYAIILYQLNDIAQARENFARSYPDLKFIRHVYQCLANYYKMAVGSEHSSGFDFLLHKFAAQYNLEFLDVFHVLKRLEEENLVQLSEGFYGSSALYIQLKHDELYKFQVANAHLDPLIKVLLRMHGGELFTQFTKISEYKLAQVLRQPENQIKDDLTRLHKLGVVAYAPKKELPQLVFLTPRLDAGKLLIDRKYYERRKQTEKKKLEFMVRYVFEHKVCRTHLIQDYFGEEIDSACGICDTCIDKKKKKADDGQNSDLKDTILKYIESKPLKIDQIVEKFKKDDPMEIILIARAMMDAGLISNDKKGYLIKL